MTIKKLTLFFVWDEILLKQYEKLQQKNLKHNLINTLPYRDSISTTTCRGLYGETRNHGHNNLLVVRVHDTVYTWDMVAQMSFHFFFLFFFLIRHGQGTGRTQTRYEYMTRRGKRSVKILT